MKQLRFKRGVRMGRKVKEVINELDIVELDKLKKDLESGGIHLKNLDRLQNR